MDLNIRCTHVSEQQSAIYVSLDGFDMSDIKHIDVISVMPNGEDQYCIFYKDADFYNGVQQKFQRLKEEYSKEIERLREQYRLASLKDKQELKFYRDQF